MHAGRHILNFTAGAEPSLLVRGTGGLSQIEIRGVLSLGFSGPKRCVGYNDGKSWHVCPNSAVNSAQCPTCSCRDIKKIYTRFDFSGYEELREKQKEEPRSIYLAYFGGTKVKCGVTRTERVEERLREQGAVLWCEALRFDDAEEAYVMEQRLQNVFGFRNAMYSNEKIRVLNDIREEVLESALGKIRSAGLDLVDGGRINRNGYAVPAEFSVSESLDGEVTGSKGEWIFFRKEDPGSHHAVNLKAKIGMTAV